jgi:endonuclease/exonuclease/phosphatase (EEP) superfamily protein YafD
LRLATRANPSEESDLLLIQEAALTAALRRSLATAGFTWLLAGSFTLAGTETGVLSAARVAPLAACVQRSLEPLLQLPKATLVARYALGGADAALANLRAINFTLGMAEYRAQLDAVARELAGHRRPLIVGGDFNTWSDARLEAMHDVMRGLGLIVLEASLHHVGIAAVRATPRDAAEGRVRAHARVVEPERV